MRTPADPKESLTRRAAASNRLSLGELANRSHTELRAHRTESARRLSSLKNDGHLVRGTSCGNIAVESPPSATRRAIMVMGNSVNESGN